MGAAMGRHSSFDEDIQEFAVRFAPETKASGKEA